MNAKKLITATLAGALVVSASTASAQIWTENFDGDSVAAAVADLDACSAVTIFATAGGSVVRPFAAATSGCDGGSFNFNANVVADPTGASGNSMQFATTAPATGCNTGFAGIALELPGVDECGGTPGGFDATGMVSLDFDILVPATTSAANEAIPDVAEDPNSGIGAFAIKFEDDAGRIAGNNWAQPRVFLDGSVVHASSNSYTIVQSDTAYTSFSIPVGDLQDTTWSWDAVVAGGCCGVPAPVLTGLRSFVIVESDGALTDGWEYDFTLDNISITGAASVNDWTVYQ